MILLRFLTYRWYSLPPSLSPFPSINILPCNPSVSVFPLLSSLSFYGGGFKGFLRGGFFPESSVRRPVLSILYPQSIHHHVLPVFSRPSLFRLYGRALLLDYYCFINRGAAST